MRGNGSQDSISQQIVVGIVDNNDDTPVNSPFVQSPESTGDQWNSNLNSPNTNTPMPRSDEISPVSRKRSSPPIPSPQEQPLLLLAVVQATACSPIPPNQDMPMENSTMEVDEETALLAELQAERLTEENARQKRRELEERLASARRKKPRQISTNPIPERGGDGESVLNPVQDSTSRL